MDKETVGIILIILVGGYLTYASYLAVATKKIRKEFDELVDFINNCDNTAENWHACIGDANRLQETGFVPEQNMRMLESLIYKKFLMK